MMMSVLKDFSLRQHHTETLRVGSGEDLLNNDRISNLSDDILVRILSLLTLKEFGSTIVLSKRWRHVWAHVPSLKFDPGTMLIYKMRFGSTTTEEELEEEELKYFCWVEQVVNSHKAYTIDEFAIRYEVHGSRKDNIDNWLRFAMEKRVKRLQLNIKSFEKTFREIPYTLPSLSPSKTLISLELDGVDVSREDLEKLLSDSQALESLSVSTTESLTELNVTGPSLNLKYLKLCCELTHLVISAPNLISFHYCGQVISWPLISTPKLAELTILGPYGNHMNNNFSEHSNISSQIESLTIDGVPFKTNLLSGVFPVFQKLKVLDITFYPRSDVELFRLSTIITSCPLLHKFALLPIHLKKLQRTKKTKKIRPFRHKHLKIFEFRGFVGYDVDIAFILYLTNGAVLAEKLTVIPEVSRSLKPYPETQLIAEKEAERLRTIIKPGMELEIGEKPNRSLDY